MSLRLTYSYQFDFIWALIMSIIVYRSGYTVRQAVFVAASSTSNETMCVYFVWMSAYIKLCGFQCICGCACVCSSVTVYEVWNTLF